MLAATPHHSFMTPPTSTPRALSIRARRLTAVGVVATLGTTAGAQGGATTWDIDPSHTAAQFAVRHLLVSTVRGQFERTSGTITWDGTDVRTIAVTVSIDAASINTRVARRDDDLRSANFFDATSYPTITFVSRKAEEDGEGAFKLTGDLTMRGVTRQVVFDVEGPMIPRRQGTMLRTGATATTRINRRDFGLTYNRMIEGAAIVGDEITITIDVEAVRRIS